MKKNTPKKVLENIILPSCQQKWTRQWKIELIEKTNPDWNDLYRSLNRRTIKL